MFPITIKATPITNDTASAKPSYFTAVDESKTKPFRINSSHFLISSTTSNLKLTSTWAWCSVSSADSKNLNDDQNGNVAKTDDTVILTTTTTIGHGRGRKNRGGKGVVMGQGVAVGEGAAVR